MTLIPNSEADAAYVVRNAAADGKTLALCGGNTRAGFGNAVDAVEVVSSRGLTGIVDYEPGEMVMTARAGTPVAEIEAALAANRPQFYKDIWVRVLPFYLQHQWLIVPGLAGGFFPALRATRVVRVPRRTFEWLLNTSIPFNRFLLVQLNERLGQFIGMLETQRLHGPDVRVARCVAQLFNPILYPGIDRKIEVSQEEIGYLSGISRQRVNQALQTLQHAGLLKVEYAAIVIEDLEGLRQYDK